MPIRRLYLTWQTLVHEIAKFGVVGAFNYLLDVGVFNLLLGAASAGPLTSKTCSTIVAATSSYFMNRHWTWRNRARTGLMREYRLFMALSAVALVVTLAPLGVSYYLLDFRSKLASNVSANVIGVGLAMVFRFWAFKRWVFLAPKDSTEDVTPAEAAVRTTI